MIFLQESSDHLLTCAGVYAFAYFSCVHTRNVDELTYFLFSDGFFFLTHIFYLIRKWRPSRCKHLPFLKYSMRVHVHARSHVHTYIAYTCIKTYRQQAHETANSYKLFFRCTSLFYKRVG